MDFTKDQLQRYSRHILLNDIGVEGQKKISKSKVFIIGAGGLGSPATLYLAAAGVGTIGIADADTVKISNLQRQIIHTTNDIGKPKVESARSKVQTLNPDVNVKTYQIYISSDNISEIINDYDFIIDCSDNYETKFLINDACVANNIPFSHGGIFKFEGQTMTVIPGKSACYRCVFSAPPPQELVPKSSQAGLLGAIAGILGTIQAAETLKYITNVGKLLTNQLLVFDAKTMDFRKITFKKKDTCPICSK